MMISDNLKIVNTNLEEWIREDDNANCFPCYGTTSYPSCYRGMADYMNANIHPEVTTGAILNQVKNNASLSFDQVIYLNDHGPDHVKMVIDRATKLLRKSSAKLSPYEAYILLVAIHFHDVGIWLGRDEHEKKIHYIMQIRDIQKHLPTDDLVLKVIRTIAQAHGGYVDGDKDTIKGVKREMMLQGRRIRKQFLAAILRFSDELADDNTRAKRFAVNGDNNIPDYCKIFHEYSNSLHTVSIKEKQIDLHFHIPKRKAISKFNKQVKNGDAVEVIVETYLLDEIFKRTLKMHREKMYCMRFLISGGIFIEKIGVTIEIVADDYSDTLKEIHYELQEKGYPSSVGKISNLCPNLNGMDGERLARELS